VIEGLKGKRGFTLIELLIVAGLIAVILLPISMFFTANLGHFYRENDRISAQSEAGRLMELITARAMESTDYKPEHGTHQFTAGDGKWVFKHEDTKLYYNTDRKKADEMTELSSNVTGFEIKAKYWGPNTVGVDITLEVTYDEEKCGLKNTVYFRN